MAGSDTTGPKLFVFDCGRIRLPNIEAFNLQETDTDVRELSAPCYVVDHAKGQLLWDAGLPSEVAAAEGWVVRPDGLANTLDETLASQMQRMSLGFDMDTLEYVAFSYPLGPRGGIERCHQRHMAGAAGRLRRRPRRGQYERARRAARATGGD